MHKNDKICYLLTLYYDYEAHAHNVDISRKPVSRVFGSTKQHLI
jgi:hypothetical protein